MIRPVVVAFALSWFGTAALAQRQQASPALSTRQPAAGRDVREAAAEASQRTRTHGGSCQLGVVSIVGNKFEFVDTGLGQFDHQESWARIDWDLDDLVFSRVKAAASGINVRRIDFDKEELHRASQISSLFQSFDSRLRDWASKVASGTPCDRYVVVHRELYPIDGRREEALGVGAVHIRGYNLNESAYLHALTTIRLYDGTGFQLIEKAAATTGDDGGPMDFKHPAPFRGPKRQIDIASFPTTPQQAAINPAFRATIRSLLASSLDQTLPKILRPQPRETSQ
jgi:hypothetical protein